MSDFSAEFSAALLAFNAEAVVYCRGISDVVAQEYATEYVRMLQSRAKGIDAQRPRIPSGLFEPNRNLIRSTLDDMGKALSEQMRRIEGLDGSYTSGHRHNCGGVNPAGGVDFTTS